MGTAANAATAALAALRGLLSPAERAALRPPEKIGLADWAEKYRYLTRRQSSRPGWWRNSNSPATVAFMRLCERPGIRQITILKHSQGGWSEAARNWIAKKAHLEPDPMLVVLPDEKVGKKIVHDRLIPLFQDTKVLAGLATGRKWDQKNNQILLNNGFTLRLGYSGSISSVASDPSRFVLCDERSKFQVDPKVSIVASIEARTSSFEQPLIINLSTPGADPDPTAALFDAANIKLYFFVTCPHCGREQVPTFSALKWEPHKEQVHDKHERAKLIRHNRSAWLECVSPACRGRMTDQHRRALVTQGFWATADLGWRIWCDGREAGRFPVGTTVGMHAPAFTSLMPRHSLVELAALWAEAEGDLERTRGYRNELLAEVDRPVTQYVSSDTFQRKCRADPASGFVPAKAKHVPAWASRVVMTVDTQKDHFYFVIRAYGHNLRSRRLHHGKVESFDELTYLADQTRWPYEAGSPGGFAPLPVHMTGIDSGGGKMGTDASRTDAVYRWCLADRARRKPLKGWSEPRDRPIEWRRVTYKDPDGRRAAYVTILWMLDSHYFNDLLASHTEQTVAVVHSATGEVSGEEDLWQLNDDCDEEYNRHLAGMKKVAVRTRQGLVERWRASSEGARIDYRMCEVYSLAMAHGPAQCLILPTLEMMLQQAAAVRQARAAPAGGVRTPDGRAFLANRR